MEEASGSNTMVSKFNVHIGFLFMKIELVKLHYANIMMEIPCLIQNQSMYHSFLIIIFTYIGCLGVV